MQEILKLDKGSTKRARLMQKLRREGDFFTAKVVPVRVTDKSCQDEIACKYCLGYYAPKSLYRHVKKCYFNPEPAKRCQAQVEGRRKMAELFGSKCKLGRDSRSVGDNNGSGADDKRRVEEGLEDVKVMKGKKRTLVSWTQQQKDLTKEYFKYHIENKIAPVKGEVMDLIRANPGVFDNKTWPVVKVYVCNQYYSKK